MKTTTFQFRVDVARRERWRAAAADQSQDESKFARDALDAWADVCKAAAAIGVNPRDLLVMRGCVLPREGGRGEGGRG